MKNKIITAIIIIVIIANFLPLDKVVLAWYYNYSNESGSFTFSEYKSRDLDMMNRTLAAFKKNNSTSDTTVYRLFRKNPLAIWRWKNYFFAPQYKYPYKNWSDIEAQRPKGNRTGYQDF